MSGNTKSTDLDLYFSHQSPDSPAEGESSLTIQIEESVMPVEKALQKFSPHFAEIRQAIEQIRPPDHPCSEVVIALEWKPSFRIFFR